MIVCRALNELTRLQVMFGLALGIVISHEDQFLTLAG